MKLKKLIFLSAVAILTVGAHERHAHAPSVYTDPIRVPIQQRIDKLQGVIDFSELAARIPGLKIHQLLRQVVQKPTLLVFYNSVNCPPSKEMLKVLKELDHYMKSIQLNVRVVKINAAQYPSIAQLYNVNKTPKFAMHKQGRFLTERYGEMEMHELLRFIRTSLQ